MTWREHTQSALGEAGHRAGGARAVVIDLLAGERCCVSAQEIYERIRSTGRTVGIASVYRTLDLLSELKVVQRVDIGDGIARFERALVDGPHHHHVVCDDCGRVEPFTDARLERAIELASGRLGYAVDAHEVVLRGECGECRA